MVCLARPAPLVVGYLHPLVEQVWHNRRTVRRPLRLGLLQQVAEVRYGFLPNPGPSR